MCDEDGCEGVFEGLRVYDGSSQEFSVEVV
jgi:hypothetical protein